MLNEDRILRSFYFYGVGKEEEGQGRFRRSGQGGWKGRKCELGCGGYGGSDLVVYQEKLSGLQGKDNGNQWC